MICLLLASLTFKNFPLRGNTPYLSLPTNSIPASAKLLAESPSVRIMVQASANRVPASLASSSFGTPKSFAFLPDYLPKFLAILASSFALAILRIASTTPESRIPLRNFSVSSILLPKSEDFVFRVSFVWEPNAGFSTRQFTKIHRLDNKLQY